MSDKVVYLFAEKGLFFGEPHYTICPSPLSLPSLMNPLTTAQQLRRYEREGFTVIDTDVPIGDFISSLDPHEWRQIRDEDRRILARNNALVACWEEYPGIADLRERSILYRLIANLFNLGTFI